MRAACCRSFASVQGMNSREAPSPLAAGEIAERREGVDQPAFVGVVPRHQQLARPQPGGGGEGGFKSRRPASSGLRRKISTSSTLTPVSASRRSTSRSRGVSPTMSCCGSVGRGRDQTDADMA